MPSERGGDAANWGNDSALGAWRRLRKLGEQYSSRSVEATRPTGGTIVISERGGDSENWGNNSALGATTH